MYCECGYFIEVSVYNSRVIYCPFCGKRYEACIECGIYYRDTDLIQGLCEECLDEGDVDKFISMCLD